MTSHRNSSHSEQVEAWGKKNCENLPSEVIVQIFGSALSAIQKRSLVTLSSVTVLVVADRALHQSKEKFPFLSAITIEPHGFSLTGLVKSDVSAGSQSLRESLEHLLIEFLTVLGNITADVLTAPLHEELKKITVETIHLQPELQTLRMAGSKKTSQGDR